MWMESDLRFKSSHYYQLQPQQKIAIYRRSRLPCLFLSLSQTHELYQTTRTQLRPLATLQSIFLFLQILESLFLSPKDENLKAFIFTSSSKVSSVSALSNPKSLAGPNKSQENPSNSSVIVFYQDQLSLQRKKLPVKISIKKSLFLLLSTLFPRLIPTHEQ